MDTQKLFILKNPFDFVDKGFLIDFLYRTLFRFGNSFWVLVFNLFEFIIKHLSRSHVDDDHKNDSDGIIVKENSDFSFGFKFEMDEDFNKGVAEKGSSGAMENGFTMSTSKYQFMSAKDFGGFVEERETVNFTVQQSFVGSNEDFIINGQNKEIVQELHNGSNHSSIGNDHFTNAKVSCDEDLAKINVSETEYAEKEKTEESVTVQELFVGSNVDSISNGQNFISGVVHNKDLEKTNVSEAEKEKAEESVKSDSFCVEEETLTSNEASKDEQVNWLGEYFLKKENLSYGIQILPENQFLPFDPEPESDNSSDGFPISPWKVDSRKLDEFDSERNGIEELECETPKPETKEIPSSEEIDEDYTELKTHLENPSELVEEIMDSEDISNVLGKSEEYREEKKSWDYDSGSDEEDEEHEDLIYQMKMELKNARTGGLPTIFEECETPKIVEDLKPMKIDEKIEHRDRMGEIQKFYKSYAEKMRKLDVLNYQTLQAISFLRLKHPEQLILGENASFSVIKSILSPNFWPCKLRRIYADPTLKSITELQRDLEVVYVGQVCLSWEILLWQYGKARELQEYDSHGNRSYNQVAVEFQQFQVLVQRFTEDEQFQGPRIQTYVEKRCILRSLLQVPTIKDNCLKDKKRRIEQEEDAIPIAKIAEIIEKSMRVFWEFLRTDKDNSSLILSKVLQGTRAYLQDPANSELLMDIKTSLQKKEKRLKDILRTGNCIVKKFQKHPGGRLDYPMFISQAELRLVSRVLSLPRLSRDQLIWCQTKLNNIYIVNGRIRVEPLFLLFPC